MNLKRTSISAAAAVALVAAGAGCSSMPGSNEQQGAVIGGATGAAVGASVTKNRTLGAVIGGAVGAAGGYVLGKQVERKDGDDGTTAEEASAQAQTTPATPEQAKIATTADVNSDGFVTLDEVVAMEGAGFSDDQMLERLRATRQVFDLNEEHSKFLLDRGVSARVVNEMAMLNRELPNNSPAPANGVISKPSNTTLR